MAPQSLSTMIAVTLAAACGAAAGPAAPTSAAAQSEPAVRRIVVLGDSLAVSPSVRDSFPVQLQSRIDSADLHWTVINAGVRGDTTAGGLGRVGPLLTDDVGVLVLALGTNDGLRGVPIATIEQNLSRIIELAQARGIRVLLCGLETLPISGIDYAVAFHHLFPRLRERYQLPFVPFLLLGVALDPDMNGPDRLHPNAAGARRIAETVWPHLRPLLVGSGQTLVVRSVSR